MWLRGTTVVDAEFSQIEEVVVAMQHTEQQHESQRHSLSVTERLVSLVDLFSKLSGL